MSIFLHFYQYAQQASQAIYLSFNLSDCLVCGREQPYPLMSMWVGVVDIRREHFLQLFSYHTCVVQYLLLVSLDTRFLLPNEISPFVITHQRRQRDAQPCIKCSGAPRRGKIHQSLSYFISGVEFPIATNWWELMRIATSEQKIRHGLLAEGV